MEIHGYDISDTLIERPVHFKAGKRGYNLYRPTLGKAQLLSRLTSAMGLPLQGSDEDIRMGVAAAVRAHRKEAVRAVAYSTLPGKGCLDEGEVSRRARSLSALDDADISALLYTSLTLDRAGEVMRKLGIDKETDLLNRAVRSKKKAGGETGALTFGGKSLWGTFIDTACERYGWTLDYVLWGISFANLQLLLADRIKTVFLTEKERKEAHISTDGIVINASDVDALKEAIRRQSWK